MLHPDVRGYKHWGEAFKGDTPCGEDLSLDPDLELLTTEIGKDKSSHLGQKTDWMAVRGLSDSLLMRSKDIWPFSCGIVAVYNTKTVRECVTCVNSLASLLATQWQSLYPSLKRPQRRLAPLKWMCDKFHSIADNTAFLSHSPEELSDLNASFRNLQEIIDNLLPENDLTFKTVLQNQLDGQVSERVAPQVVDAKSALRGSTASHTSQPMRTTLEEIEKRSLIPSGALPQVIRTINETPGSWALTCWPSTKKTNASYQFCLHQCSAREWHSHLHGRSGALAGQRLH